MVLTRTMIFIEELSTRAVGWGKSVFGCESIFFINREWLLFVTVPCVHRSQELCWEATIFES